ncbi:MAG: hypothetical protein KDE47_20320, partial [Caldilineaceae bacterium]|nr:hypothetical protein [Caldilineaceae bacterium]
QHNYVDGNGTTLWDVTTDGGIYNNQITGIGRDDAMALDQRQSRSVENGTMVTIGHAGTIADTNLNHADTLSDGQFLLWGSNGGTTAFINAPAPSGYVRIGAVWHVAESGADLGNVLLRIDGTKMPVSAQPLQLVIDADGDFSDGNSTIVPLTLNGADWEATVNLADGDYFTVARAVVAEICGNNLDDDRDGLADAYDPDCTGGVPVCSTDSVAFTIQEQTCTTSGGFSEYQSPLIADIDQDGTPEIIAGHLSTNQMRILDSTTLAVKHTINTGSGIGLKWNAMAVGQLDGAGFLEIAFITTDDRMRVAHYNGSSWTVLYSDVLPTSVINTATDLQTNGMSIADFNQDGVPELYNGNIIYSVDFSGSCTVCITQAVNGDAVAPDSHGNNGNNSGNFSVAIDIFEPGDPQCTVNPSECNGLEIVAGYRVYSVDVDAGTATARADLRTLTGSNIYADGPTAVADMNNDGQLDVVTNGINGRLYIWSPYDGTVYGIWTTSSGSRSPLSIGNIYDDDLADDGLKNGSVVDLPETVTMANTDLRAFNLNSPSTYIWTLGTSDTSGVTGISFFDFNGDSIKEIVYRDETRLRILYGGPIAYKPTQVSGADRNYTTFACGSG